LSGSEVKGLKAAEKHPSAAFLSSFVVAAYLQVRGIRQFLGPQDFACLREAASAKAGGPCIWAFLSSLREMTFSSSC
jgi:hypothetical protein